MSFNLDIAIVISFLILTLFVGLGHGSKVKNIKDYALGGRNFSTGALVATIVATWVSGSGFFITLSEAYSHGLYYVLASLFMGLNLFLTAVIFVPKMSRFLGSTSVAEAMGDLYGKEVRIITAIAGSIGSMGFIAVQFSAFGNIINYFIGSSGATFALTKNIVFTTSQIAIIVSGLVVTVYSATGGIRAVTVTDVLQTFTFCFVLPLIGIMIWNQLYTTDFSIVSALESPKFNIAHVLNFGNPEFIEVIPLMLYFAIPGFTPVIFQRISMAKDLQQVKKAFLIAAFLWVIIDLAKSWIPFLLFNVNPNLESHQLLGFMIENYTYTGLKGLLIVGIIAMAMSTADSNMNISSVLFSHDICAQLKIGVNRELLIAKIFSFLLGIGGIILALNSKDLLNIILTANSFYMPLVTMPLMLSILGFRTTKYSVMVSMAAGLCTVIVWKIYAIKSNPIAIGLFVNTVFLFATHYLFKQEGGWVKDNENLSSVKKDQLLHNSSFSIRESSTIFSKLKKLNFIQLCKQTSPKNDLTYMGFGIYCIICTISTMYATQVELLGTNGKMILTIYQIMMITGTLMASYPIWPLTIKQNYKQTFVQVWWNFAVFYMLVVFSAFFVMVSNFGQLQFVIFTANTILVAILVGWRLALAMLITGFYLSIQVYKYYAGIDVIDLSIGSPQFVFMYSLVLLGTTLVIFLKPKQEYLEATEYKVGSLGNEVSNLSEKVTYYTERISDQEREIDRLGTTAQRILNNVNHELRLPVGNVINFAELLSDGLENYTKDQLKTLSDEVYKNSNRLSTMILNMLDLATLDAEKIELDKKTVNLSELVIDRVKSCRKIYLQHKKIDFELTVEPEILMVVDANYIRQVVDNLVINAITFSESGTIKITLKKEDFCIKFTISDEGIGIAKEDIPDLFTPFKMGVKTESKAEGRGVGLALCKAAIKAHGGKIIAQSDENKGAVFKVTLPV